MQLYYDYFGYQRDIETVRALLHPRKNSVLYQFPVDTIVDDLVIVDYEFDRSQGLQPVCRCVICGRIKTMTVDCLRTHRGTTHRACGQFEKLSDKRFYKIWCSMKHRIYNKNYWKYDRYGGRGLTCEYDVFVDFYDDMYFSYVQHCIQFGEKDTKLDRINNNLGYVRGNLRWSTQKEQVNNSTVMSKPFVATAPDGTIHYGRNQTDFAKAHGLVPEQVGSTLRGRFKSTRGWTMHFIDSEDEKV